MGPRSGECGGSTLGLRSLFCGAFAFGHLLLGLAPHFHERVDEIVDRFMPFRLAPHPDQSVEKIVNGFSFFLHVPL
jgi:hypothetical protein